SAAVTYNGTLTVNSDATGGANMLSLSGAGIGQSNSGPPALNILGVSLNGDGSVTLTYSAATGFAYHVEATSNFFPASWMTVAGSATNATGNAVTFTEPNALGNAQRFYRVASP